MGYPLIIMVTTSTKEFDLEIAKHTVYFRENCNHFYLGYYKTVVK